MTLPSSNQYFERLGRCRFCVDVGPSFELLRFKLIEPKVECMKGLGLALSSLRRRGKFKSKHLHPLSLIRRGMRGPDISQAKMREGINGLVKFDLKKVANPCSSISPSSREGGSKVSILFDLSGRRIVPARFFAESKSVHRSSWMLSSQGSA